MNLDKWFAIKALGANWRKQMSDIIENHFAPASVSASITRAEQSRKSKPAAPAGTD